MWRKSIYLPEMFTGVCVCVCASMRTISRPVIIYLCWLAEEVITQWALSQDSELSPLTPMPATTWTGKSLVRTEHTFFVCERIKSFSLKLLGHSSFLCQRSTEPTTIQIQQWKPVRGGCYLGWNMKWPGEVDYNLFIHFRDYSNLVSYYCWGEHLFQVAVSQHHWPWWTTCLAH